LLLPVLLSGCGKGGPKVVPVSGLVTMDGKPLANADVTFTPTEAGPANTPPAESSARTDGEGRYTLKTIKDKRDGAVVGKHKVRISLIERGGTIVNKVPAEYNKDTTLTCDVPAEGKKDADFKLTSDGKGR
jgi:hypothetical protein